MAFKPSSELQQAAIAVLEDGDPSNIEVMARALAKARNDSDLAITATKDLEKIVRLIIELAGIQGYRTKKRIDAEAD